MKKLYKMCLCLLLSLIILSSTCFAATTNSDKLNLEIVENNVCTINIKDSAIFEKKIIDYDLENKEINMQLKITNISEKPLAEPTEIFLVIDSSDSMKKEVSSGVTRFDAVKQAANKLATELLKNDTVKVGVVSYSVSKDSSEFGTLADSKLELALSNSTSSVTSTIEKISLGNGQTDIDAGITRASQNFSGTCEHKYIILLSDGVPNVSLGNSKFQYSGTTSTNTKNTLQKLTTVDKINLITVMTGVESNVYNPETGLSYKELAEEIFGTSTEPNYGKFYYISDSQIETTISTNVLSDIIDKKGGTLTNIDIYDYFPQEIVDNFDFEYVTSPNLGTISPTIDLQNNCIVWHIDTLDYGEVGTVSYKLKVKSNVDSSIINVVLNTNTKVDITANELDNPLTSSVSPKIKLTGDTTKAPKVIPQTGISNTLFISIVFLLFVTITLGFKFYIIDKNMKH